MSTTSTQPRYARAGGTSEPVAPESSEDLVLDFLDGTDEDFGPEPVDPDELARQHVTAVLVAHEGRRWLPKTLEALAKLDRPPDLVVAVDTGSKDDTAELLGRSLGEPAVITAKRNTGFGAAIGEAIESADTRTGSVFATGRVKWIWLLHDDSAPEPAALARLLECAVRNPDAAVIGPKVRGWGEARQLLEVGLTMTTGGRRYTGLERRELDQGQHDETRDVLAVGSAGMLVRRDVWDSLNGFDPQLALFRDDIDFGWRANLAGYRVLVCPDAVMRHAEAAAHGRRRIGITRQRPHLLDRRNALRVVLANSSLRRLPLTLLQVSFGCLMRSLGFLFGKLPLTAAEELLALGAVLLRPDRLIRARLARRHIRNRTPDELRPLFPARGHQVRYAMDTLMSVVSGTGAGQDLTMASRRASVPLEDGDEQVAERPSAFWGFVGRPWVVVPIVLLVVALLAERALLLGGSLMGGAMLPAQESWNALWQTYTTSWHGVGLGSSAAAPPYLAVVAMLSALSFGNVGFAVSVLLLLSVPLAGLTAYFGLRHVVDGRWVRVWGAATYGLLPATTGAIAAGRLGTCVAIVTTPLLAVAVLRTLGTIRQPGSLRTAWSAGLLLAITAAFVPLAWLVAVALCLAAVGLGYRSRAALVRFAILLLVPPVLLVPWTFEVLRHPVLLFGEAGAPGPGLSDSDLPAWYVAIGNPGGPGTAPWWLFLGLALAAVAGVGRRDRRLTAFTGAVVALGGLILGLVVSRVPVTGPTLDAPVAGWPGYATVLVVLGLLIAASTGAENAHQRLARASFSWRQPTAVLLTVLAVVTPFVAAGWWVWRGADIPLERREPAVLPAYVVAANAEPAHPRTLVLDRNSDGLVTYALLRDAGPRLGDAETGPGQDTSTVSDRVVGDLVSGRGTDDAAALADLAVLYVYLPAPADSELVATLDAVSGLSRASAPDGAGMWKVGAPVSRLKIVNPDGTELGLPSGQVTAAERIEPGPAGRRLVLAENADPGWEATLEGRSLEPVTVDGWAQGFELPDAGGQLTLSHQGEQRSRWLWLQAAMALVVLVLALPSARRRGEGVEDAMEEMDARVEASETLTMARKTFGSGSAVGRTAVGVGAGPSGAVDGSVGVAAGSVDEATASVGAAAAAGSTAAALPESPAPTSQRPGRRRRLRGGGRRRAADEDIRFGGKSEGGKRRRGGAGRQLTPEEWLGVPEGSLSDAEPLTTPDFPAPDAPAAADPAPADSAPADSTSADVTPGGPYPARPSSPVDEPPTALPRRGRRRPRPQPTAEPPVAPAPQTLPVAHAPQAPPVAYTPQAPPARPPASSAQQPAEQVLGGWVPQLPGAEEGAEPEPSTYRPRRAGRRARQTDPTPPDHDSTNDGTSEQ